MKRLTLTEMYYYSNIDNDYKEWFETLFMYGRGYNGVNYKINWLL